MHACGCRLSIDAPLWCIQLRNGGVGRVWEFMFLAVSTESGTQGGTLCRYICAYTCNVSRVLYALIAGAHSLQTTSRSQMRPVKDDCELACSILMVSVCVLTD